MRKTDKKIDKQLRLALTDVCETALKEINGFLWLTHLVNYGNFPESLKVICVFDTNESIRQFIKSNSKAYLSDIVRSKLDELNIKLKKIDNHLFFDSEEACNSESNGVWASRL